MQCRKLVKQSQLVECFYIFVQYPRWFHGKISREQAENLLKPREDGLFLVRESTNYPGDYTLCVSYQGEVQHYRVIYQDNKLTIDEEEFFSNLAELVEVTSDILTFQI